MRRLKTVRRPPVYPSHLPCSSLTHPAAVLTPSIGVLRWIRAKRPRHRGQAGWAVTGAREGEARGVESGRSSPPPPSGHGWTVFNSHSL